MGFGDFTTICQQTSFPICPLVGPPSKATGGTGILAICNARSIELAKTIIFEAAADFVHVIALIMTIVMIIHVRSKFTAVGKREAERDVLWETDIADRRQGEERLHYSFTYTWRLL